MHSTTAAIFMAVVCCALLPFSEQQYTANWTSLDSRPLPAWYDESKIGIFIHWGVFSVPSISSEWYVSYYFSFKIATPYTFELYQEYKMTFFKFHSCRMWYQWKGPKPSAQVVAFMNKTYPPDWTYADFAAEFRAEFYGKYRSFFLYFQSNSHFTLDPNEWADIFAASGAKYVHLISFCSRNSFFWFCLDMLFSLARFASFLKYV